MTLYHSSERNLLKVTTWAYIHDWSDEAGSLPLSKTKSLRGNKLGVKNEGEKMDVRTRVFSEV